MSEQVVVDESEVALKRTIGRAKVRFFKWLDYLALFLYVAAVSVSALIADYLIIIVIEWLVAPDASKYPLVAQAFDWFKIGSAFLLLFAAGFHAAFSAWSQIKFEFDTAKGNEERIH